MDICISFEKYKEYQWKSRIIFTDILQRICRKKHFSQLLDFLIYNQTPSLKYKQIKTILDLNLF